MIKKTAVFAILFLLVCVTPLCAQTPEESFKKDFPNAPAYEKFRPTAISGLYEIAMPDGQIIYYAPAVQSIILGGQIITNKGENLTQNFAMEIMADKFKNIKLDQAIKIGQGKNTVIEFTDPDCPYCRQGSEFLSARSDVTRYIFFAPMSSHTDAIPKIRYIFCSKDKAKAYEEAMTGKLDSMKFEICADPKVDEAIKAQDEIVKKIGINATPTYVINGTIIKGADLRTMGKLLGEAPKESEKSK